METRRQRREKEERRQREAYETDTEDEMEVVWTPKDGKPTKLYPPSGFGRGRGRGAAWRSETEDRQAWNELVADHRNRAGKSVTALGQLDGRHDVKEDGPTGRDEENRDRVEDAEEDDNTFTASFVMRVGDDGRARMFRAGEEPPTDEEHRDDSTSSGSTDDEASGAADKGCETAGPTETLKRGPPSPSSSQASERETKAKRPNMPMKRIKKEDERDAADREAFDAVVAYAEETQRKRRESKTSTSASDGFKPRGVGRPALPALLCKVTIRNQQARASRTGILRYCDVGSPIAGHDLPHGSKREEHDHSPVGPKPNDGLAYPYWRHYAREHPDHDPDCYFGVLGAREPGETLFGCDEDRKPRLHDMVKCVLEEADQHLSNNLDRAGELPGTPDILLTEHMNSAIHDHWYPDITANAARRPPIDSLEHAASARLMEVQRGALQRMDELIRLALLNHSAAMCAKDQMHNNSGKECMGLTSSDVYDYAMDQNTHVLVELLHQLTYAHRRAYVRHAPTDVQRNVLRQPILGQRELFLP